MTMNAALLTQDEIHAPVKVLEGGLIACGRCKRIMDVYEWAMEPCGGTRDDSASHGRNDPASGTEATPRG